nr:RNA-directed DNA polymerase, eukaryota, reverse transcriptase zinc-binding domain protein [Tanacetum cinerariifolium]
MANEAEIRDAIWDCGSENSPGPDGFTFTYYKRFWDMIKVDVVVFVQDFFTTGSLLRGCNSSFIALILKVSNPMANLTVFKIDFEKAFDIVSWDFSLQVMQFMGFSEKWMKWILGCLYSATSSVLINGSPTREFNIKRSLRQGDPLSPFLFIITMEGLHVVVEYAMAAGLYRGFKVNTLRLSHLFFADDALFLGEWS